MTTASGSRYAAGGTLLLVAAAALAVGGTGGAAVAADVPLARGHAAKRLIVSLAFVGALLARRRGRD
ncbi:MAG: hypothetical protein ABEJ88_03265 [Halobacterium sp.]